MSPHAKLFSFYEGKEFPAQNDVINTFIALTPDQDAASEKARSEDVASENSKNANASEAEAAVNDTAVNDTAVNVSPVYIGHTINSAVSGMSDEDICFLCYAAARANHTRFLISYFMPAIANRPNHGWLSWLLWGLRLEHVNSATQLWYDLFAAIEQVIPLTELLTKPQSDGCSPWDELLGWARSSGANNGESEAYIHAKLAHLSKHVSSLSQEFLTSPHPLYPECSRQDVWLWGWCSITMSSSRVSQIAKFIALGANPNTSLEVAEGVGKLSTGSVLLLSYNQTYSVPRYKTRVNIWKNRRVLIDAIVTRVGAWEDEVPSATERNASPSIVMSAFRMLIAGGMDTAELSVNHRLGSPLLVLYNAIQLGKPIWDFDSFKALWVEFMSRGLILHHPQNPRVNLLTMLAEIGFSDNEGPKIYPALWVSDGLIPASTMRFLTDDESLLSFARSPRGACLFIHDPRLSHLLITRLGACAPSEFTNTLLKTPPVHPLSALGSRLEEFLLSAPNPVITDIAISLIHTMMTNSMCFPISGDTQPSVVPNEQGFEKLYITINKLKSSAPKNSMSLANMSPDVFAEALRWLSCAMSHNSHAPIPRKKPSSKFTPAEQVALDKTDATDPRPRVLLYTEKDAAQFNTWASSREAENESLKSWKSKVYSKQNDKVVLPNAARPLALASSALASITHLRSAFPHFGEIVDLIERHLLLQARGNGAFSLPPLLMAGPPGTGKTFFFQELAAAVSTHYSMLSMEGVSGGFSIVGLDYGWSSSSPGHVFETLMADQATINPIILLDELDKTTESNYPVAPVLLPLLEPHSARRFADRAVPMTIDASHICWVATANELDRVALPLRSRFNVLHVPQPDYHARRAMAGHIYTSLRSKSSWGHTFDEQMSEETLETLARPNGAARDLRKNISEGFASAAKSNRASLLPHDIPPPANSQPPSLWDQPLPDIKPSQIHLSRNEPGIPSSENVS